MRGFRRWRLALLIIAIPCLIWSQDAAAYLEPGTGSYLLQLLIASLLGVLVMLKLTWHKAVTALKHLFTRKPKQRRNGG